MMYAHVIYDAFLMSPIFFTAAVKLPFGEDLNDWLASNSKDHVCFLYCYICAELIV